MEKAETAFSVSEVIELRLLSGRDFKWPLRAEIASGPAGRDGFLCWMGRMGSDKVGGADCGISGVRASLG